MSRCARQGRMGGYGAALRPSQSRRFCASRHPGRAQVGAQRRVPRGHRCQGQGAHPLGRLRHAQLEHCLGSRHHPTRLPVRRLHASAEAPAELVDPVSGMIAAALPC
eukprot:scaffold23417_cov71-Phaeocystis_antarctica.AAC.2